MQIVGTETVFTKKVEAYIKKGKAENDGSNKPTSEEVNRSTDELFTSQPDVMNDYLNSLANE